MPIYEYACRQCGKTSTIFTRSMQQKVEARCSACGSADMDRAISTFAYHASTSTIHDKFGPSPSSPTLDYYKDPRNIGRHVEESFKKFDMEVPQAVQESIRAAREGALPKEVQL